MKKIIAILLASTMVAFTFIGCGSQKSVDDITEKDVESAFGKMSDNSSSSDVEETTLNEKSSFKPTDEIKNADFNSGLIQIGNDVFQTGGYITVKDFIDKYKDRYEDETGEKILQGKSKVLSKEYGGSFSMSCKEKTSHCTDTIVVSYKNKPNIEKCSIYDAIVIDVKPYFDVYLGRCDYQRPTWLPQGFTVGQRMNDDDESENYVDYTHDSCPTLIESLGYKKFKTDYPKYSDGEGYAAREYGGITIQANGTKKNLLNQKPFYKYDFTFYNTDCYAYGECEVNATPSAD